MDSTLPAAPAAAPAAEPAIRQLRYNGKTSRLFSLWVGNWILVILTLGVYHFWAKTKLRRFFHEHTLFLDEPFTYLGTGREIFLSALKFVFMFVLPMALVAAAITALFHDNWLAILVPIFYGVAFYCLRLYAMLSGMRYRANRMSWRGVRFALKVRKSAYLAMVFRVMLLNFATLGLYRPYGDARFLKLFVNNLSYGNLSFSYAGDSSEITKGYWLYWLAIPFTLGSSLHWYRARLYKHIAKSTRLGPMEFRYNITGGQLFWLSFSNWLLLLASFGVLGFYAMERQMHLFTDTLRMRGLPNFSTIKKAAIETDAAGAADYLGADEDFGF